MKIYATICAVALTLTGCTGFLPPEHDTALERSAACCRDFAGLPFRDLAQGQKVRMLVGPDTPTFLFPQGKSFFLAFRLNSGGNGVFVVRSYPQNMLNNRNGHVFVPRVTFLSGRYGVIASVSPEFTVQGPRLGIGESSWRTTLSVPAGADFAIVHTSDHERIKVMSMRDRDQRDGYLYTRTGPAGEIEVELQ